jgi:hypothetical protein
MVCVGVSVVCVVCVGVSVGCVVCVGVSVGISPSDRRRRALDRAVDHVVVQVAVISHLCIGSVSSVA